MRKANFVLIIGLLATLISSCSGSKTTTPPSDSLYFDNYSQPTSGWTRSQTADCVMDYTKDTYHIRVDKPGALLLATPGKTFDGDISIEVDARKIGGSDDNYFGIMCHYIDADNYYMLLITSDGYAGITERIKGVDQVISPSMRFIQMKGIKKGKTTNHIQAVCAGEQMTLFANGLQVSVAYDKTLKGGGVGLAVRSGRLEGITDISFDNFTVSKAPQP